MVIFIFASFFLHLLTGIFLLGRVVPFLPLQISSQV